MIRQAIMRPVTSAAHPNIVWPLLVLVGLWSAGCTDSPTSSTSTSGTPATITLVATLVGSGPPTASIVATVRDPGSYVVGNVLVKFSTTSGFITAGGRTGADGVAIAMLTGAAGTSPTVTASVTTDTDTVTESTVVHF